MVPKQESRLVDALERLAAAMESIAETQKTRLNKEYPKVRKKVAQVFNTHEEPEGGESFKGRYERKFEESSKG